MAADCNMEIAMCSVDELSDSEVIGRITPQGESIALYKLDGTIYATEDLCSHGAVALSGGFVEGDVIECPAHGGRFHIPTGMPTCFPAQKPIRTLAVRVCDGIVYLEMNDAP